MKKWRLNTNRRSSGIAIEMNCPGRARSAISGATSVSEW
jgi:hypothetical protein